MIPGVFLYRVYCLMEEKDNNTNELEELILEEIDINEDPADAFPYVLALAAMCFAGAALCIRKSSLAK